MDLIYEDTKYQLTAMQTAPGSFLLACNGSTVEAEIRSLADGGYLVLMGGKSHVAYMKVRGWSGHPLHTSLLREG